MSDQSQIWHDLSSAQQAIWLDCALLDDVAAYQVGTVLSGKGQIDPERARRATAAVIADHQALRLRIDADQPRQRLVAPDYGVLPFNMVTLQSAADLPDHLWQCTRHGFPLGAGSLFRVEAIQAGPDDWAVLVTGHHLIVDGLSIGMVRDDWALAYGAAADAPYPGPRATFFLDSLAGDAAYAGSPAMAEDLAYWQQRLADLPESLFDTIVSDGTRADARITISAERYSALAEAARSLGTTVHRVLVAIVGLALGRRFGRRDLVIGMALHGRPNDHLETVGQFARVLPVRCTFDPSQTLADGLRAVAAGLVDDMKHQRVPMDAIGRALGGNGTSQAELFEVAVSIMPPPAMGGPKLGDMPATIQAQSGQEHSPFSVFMREQVDGSLIIGFGHDPAKVGGAEVARIGDRIEAVIQRLLERPTAKISALPALTRNEMAQIAGFENGPREKLETQLPLDLLRNMIAQHGDAPAVIEGEQRWSYAAIDALSDSFAASFAARGIGKGDVVGVIITRSCDTIATFLGLLKLGAVYLPIDTSQPPARAEAMLAAAKVRLVLTEGAWLSALGGQFPLIERSQMDRNAALPANTAAASAGDPAYIIFTSGSTGIPKGVVVPHRAIANLDNARQRHDPIGPGDHVLAAISVGFDVSIGQLLLPLLRGACVVIAPDVRLMSPAQFWAFLAENRVTHINSVPSFFDAMLDGAPDDARLKRLMLGGEPLSATLARKLRARLNGTQVVNMYGPTEACVDASAYMVPADLSGEARSLPIGRPLPNYSFFILDAKGAQVGIGHAGELFIGGLGLANGYLDAPELNRERFVDSDYGRIYRTGDLAAWHEDGEVLFLGRADGQVKIRGHRIELGEIEARLLEHADVASAAVIARADAGGALRLLGYVVPTEGASPPTALLQGHLAAALPSYMVPAAIMLIDKLPLTTNGKLDQRALPDPGTVKSATPSRAPETADEQMIAAMFSELLGVDAVQADDDFFQLGGHSLLATRLVGRLREATDADLRIRDVYAAPTVALLAKAMAAAPRAAGENMLAAISPRPEHIPLSFAQERLWFLHRLEPGSAAYNIPLVFRAEGALDADAMQRALAAVIARHESLRTRFAAHDGEPMQVIEDAVETPFTCHDLTGEDPANVQQAIMAEALRPFDLTCAPLVRLALIRVADDAHVAVLVIHHIVADGWSMAVLLDELTRNYVTAATGAPAGDAPLELHYADYALWQRTMLAGPELERQRAFWLTDLAGAPDLLELPADADADQRHAPGDGGLQPVVIDAATGEKIAELAAKLQCSPFAVLMAGWSLLLGRWTGQRDLLVGTALAGRQDSRLDNQIGFYVNTLPVRSVIDPTEGASGLIAQTAARMLDIQSHQDMPFEQLVQALRPHRPVGRHPLFQALFVLQNGPAPALALDGLTISPVPLPSAPARFDLALSLAPDGAGFAGEISFARHMFRADTIKSLADRFARLLAEMADNADGPVSALQALQDWGSEWRAPAVPNQPRSVPKSGDTLSDPLQREVAALWAEVIGAETIGPDDNFFDLGGHSLAALRLTARLEAMLGRSVPVSLIFSHQTLAAYCTALGEETPGAIGPLVPIQQGDGPPLVCIHPVGGGVFGYAALARALAPGRQVLGLQAAGFDDDQPLADSVNAMAADYVAALREVQPHGPYHLLGHSFGGMLGYAMAQQLVAAGESVATLVMLDTDYPVAGAAPDYAAPLLASVPQDKQALLANNIRLASQWTPQGSVPVLTYLRADGDGRDNAREAAWLAHGEAATALPPLECGHYAMLDTEQADAIADRLKIAMVYPTFTMLGA